MGREKLLRRPPGPGTPHPPVRGISDCPPGMGLNRVPDKIHRLVSKQDLQM